MAKSAQPVVRINAIVSTIVFFVQLLKPDLLYDGHIARWMAKTANLPHPGPLTPHREPMHGVLITFHLAILVHIWSAALSSRPHAHIGTALMEFTYALSALTICALFPRYASGVMLFGALPNLAFASMICRWAGVGPREVFGMLGGDLVVASVDRKGVPKEGEKAK